MNGQDDNVNDAEKKKTVCLETEDSINSGDPIFIFPRRNFRESTTDSSQPLQRSGGSFLRVKCITYPFRTQSTLTNKASDLTNDISPEPVHNLNGAEEHSSNLDLENSFDEVSVLYPTGITDKSIDIPKRPLKETKHRMCRTSQRIKILSHMKSKQVKASASASKVKPVIVRKSIAPQTKESDLFNVHDSFLQNNKKVGRFISCETLASHQEDFILNMLDEQKRYKGNKPVCYPGVSNSSTRDDDVVYGTAPHLQLSHNHSGTASLSKDTVESLLPEVAPRIICIPLTEELNISQESIIKDDMGQNHVSVSNNDQNSKGILAVAVPQSPTTQLTNHSLESNGNVLGSSSLSEVENYLTCNMSSKTGPSTIEVVYCNATPSQSSPLNRNETATLSKGIIKLPLPGVAPKINYIPLNMEYKELHHISASSKDKNLKGISTIVVPQNHTTRLTNHSLRSDGNVMGGSSLSATENYMTCPISSEVNLRSDKNSSSDSASFMGAMNPVSQKLHLDEGRQDKKVIPSVESCIPSWKKVFPWIDYVKAGNCFICKICYWGNVNNQNSVIYTLKNPRDVLCVAGQLRIHKNTTTHENFSAQLKRVSGLLQHMYSRIKSNSFDSLNDITDALSSQADGKFLRSLIPTEKTYFVSYAIRYIAECIELNLLRSLDKSPFFSIVAFEEMDYAVLRWLNHKGKPEEHIFSNQITCPGEIMSISFYLRQKNVNMTKMISYSNFPTSLSLNLSNDWTQQIPVRGPPLSVCLKWLEQTELLKSLFSYVETLVKLCKRSHHKFMKFPEAQEVVKVEEPYGHNFIVNENIMRFFFQNFKELKMISREIYEETGNVEAYYISTMDIENNDSVQFCLSPLPSLYLILNKEIYDFSSICTVLKEFRSKVNGRRPENIDHRIDEVMYLLDTYLSHIIIFLDTQNQCSTGIFTEKLKNININVMDDILTKTQADYRGGSKQCLQDLYVCCRLMSVSEDCTIMELLECLFTKSDFHQTFPHLLRLHQRISVLPCFCADVEQYKFDIMSSQMFLKGKVIDELVSPLALILLEGPSVEKIGVEYYLAHWSKKWKMRID